MTYPDERVDITKKDQKICNIIYRFTLETILEQMSVAPILSVKVSGIRDADALYRIGNILGFFP
jgi:hypothetical protein